MKVLKNHTRTKLHLPLIMASCLFAFSCSHQENAGEEKIYMEHSKNLNYKDAAAEEGEAVYTEAVMDDVYYVEPNTEEYQKIQENSFQLAMNEPLSTFSIDVDNASYANVRRFLNENMMPNPDAVRIEEMINYFDYGYKNPTEGHPFSITTELGACPWNLEHKLVHIGIQGKRLDYKDLKPSNLVFLIDASGSMSDNNKLPLLKKSLGLLLDELGDNDRIAIVAYAGSAGLVLPSTSATQKSTILDALDRIESGGSTAGGEGIQLAYNIAIENLIKDGNNRIILATDGDFNVGTSGTDDLIELIEEKRKQDIYLTICGFGMGNYKDEKMERISNAGNGNYFYIDNIKEAEKVFVKEMRANMFTIAKDVKIQVEFNPAIVESYRLIGYENRMLNNEDFEDDKKDAGELGAGHTVTALYEIVIAEGATNNKLKYTETIVTGNKDEIMSLKFRYKPIHSDVSVLIENKVVGVTENENLSDAFNFSSAVAGFGLLLRDSQYKGNLTYDKVLDLANSSTSDIQWGADEYKLEFARLVSIAKLLDESDDHLER
jgi:Ca-activated chloride channel homolog